MRVTNRLMSQQMNTNLQSALRRMHAKGDQIATGRRIQLPSDDPLAYEAAARLRGMAKESEQYLRNVSDAITWLDLTEASLEQISEGMQRARELAVYGASDTLSAEERLALAAEIDQIYGQVIQVANSRMGDRYLFGGDVLSEAPFGEEPDPTGPFEPVQSRTASFEVSPGLSLSIGVHASEAIQPAVEVLAELKAALEANDRDAIDQTIGKVDDALSTLIVWRAEAGARINRLELIEARLYRDNANLQQLLSERENVDLAEAIMELKVEEAVYRAALAVGARVIQPTLLDFLR